MGVSDGLNILDGPDVLDFFWMFEMFSDRFEIARSPMLFVHRQTNMPRQFMPRPIAWSPLQMRLQLKIRIQFQSLQPKAPSLPSNTAWVLQRILASISQQSWLHAENLYPLLSQLQPKLILPTLRPCMRKPLQDQFEFNLPTSIGCLSLKDPFETLQKTCFR